MKTSSFLNLTIGLSLIINLIAAIIISSSLQYADLIHVITIGSIILLSWFLLPKILPLQKSTYGANNGLYDFGLVPSFLSLGLLHEVFYGYPKSAPSYFKKICLFTPFLAILFWLYSLGFTAFPLVLKIIWLLLTIPMIFILHLGADKVSYAMWIPTFLLPILQAIALITGIIRFFLLDISTKVEIGQSLLIVIGFAILTVLWAGSLEIISNAQRNKSKLLLDNPRVCIFVRVINPENQDCKVNSTALNKQRGFLHEYANSQGYKLDRIQYTVDNGYTEETDELKQYRQAFISLLENPNYNIFLVEKEESLARFGIEEAKRILKENGKYLEVFNQEIEKSRQIENKQIFTISIILHTMVIIGGLIGGWRLNLFIYFYAPLVFFWILWLFLVIIFTMLVIMLLKDNKDNPYPYPIFVASLIPLLILLAFGFRVFINS
ncbi:hypothetical protein [Okeania sp.]|uniref:hypothetical protein n=1 Tax=Okeania sp. TaxID=3100323 RepID=UPI002B4AFE20|nr:hypothetical protein [Okeania sp.]MEB3340160.1 hypothetical protein [Okeania sp.]